MTADLQITRGELFRRLWETPLIRVAGEFGLTNFLLADICRRHQIPTPPAGHWSKVAHGKDVAKPQLPGDAEALITVANQHRRGYRPSKAVSRAERRAKRAAAGEQEIVPDNVAVHRKAAKTIAKLRSQSGAGLRTVGGAGCFRVTVSAAAIDRSATVLDRLLTAVEERGWSVRSGEHRLELDIDQEVIGFELVELTDRVAHRPTEAELLAKSRYDARVAQAKRTGAYVSTWDAPKIPEWERVPNGKLSLVLDPAASYLGVRRTFSDRKSQRVETLIDCIADALEGYSVATKERRVENERRRIAAEAEQRRQELLRKREELELKRIEFADRQLARVERVERLHVLIERLGSGELPPDLERFRAWLKGYVENLEWELSPERLAEKLALTDLMNDEAVVPAWIDVETGRYGRT